MRLRVVSLGMLASASAFVACSPAAESPASPVEAPILGPAVIDDSCNEDEARFIDLTLHYARTLVETPAFGQCIEVAVRNGFEGIGPYRACPGDPAYDHSAGRAIILADQTVTTSNSTLMRCGGTRGLASAGVGTFGNDDPEVITWAGWLDAVIDQLAYAPCSEGLGEPCRTAADPWPYSQAVGIAYHEAAHQQGWKHPDNKDVTSDAAKAECGYAPEDDYNYQTNSMAYILGNCATWVISQSANACGASGVHAIDDASLGLTLISGIDSSECQDYTDMQQGWPRPHKTGKRHR